MNDQNTDVTTYDRQDVANIESDNATMAIATARSAQEVQAAMAVAQRFPRNEIRAIENIVDACKRVRLAETAVYTYPRGGTVVEGPSIRLAEVAARYWGNMDFGVVELNQNEFAGKTECMAYAWDLQTNVRDVRIFTSPHVRRVGKVNKRLSDPRDIYEMNANLGARRKRSCILSIVPGDVIDVALEQVNKTLKEGSTEPLRDRVTKMILAFDGEFDVTEQMLEARIGHNLSSMTEHELVKLRKIYVSIRDAASKPSDWFETAGARKSVDKPKTTSETVADDLISGASNETAT